MSFLSRLFSIEEEIKEEVVQEKLSGKTYLRVKKELSKVQEDLEKAKPDELYIVSYINGTYSADRERQTFFLESDAIKKFNELKKMEEKYKNDSSFYNYRISSVELLKRLRY